MALLLDDLLDVARITNGSLQLRKSSVTLASLADAALESALPYIESKQHHLVRDLPEPDAILAVDALRISQVIGNLLTNAAKYTDPRGRITLSARRDGPQWLISVADNGVGISPEQLGRLFEMFAQLPTSAGRSQGGLGIGLALSRALVRLHGGDITATSAGAGGGSVFTVRLPAEPMASDSEPSGAAPDAGAARIAVPALRVLVADDNADAAESLAALLRIDGHEVHVAYDGEQALAAFSQLEPQAALLDVGMPRLSGLEVARAIRRLPAGKRAVMIALTGWGQPRDRSEALEAGFDHHTTKPVDPTHIQALIAASRTRNG
jgi:CheY-like chemotaxis protein/two-component sensor histidine kinase